MDGKDIILKTSLPVKTKFDMTRPFKCSALQEINKVSFNCDYFPVASQV